MGTQKPTLQDNTLHELLKLNTINRTTETIPGNVVLSSLFLFSDMRANMDPIVTALATMFVLEHNSQAGLLQSINPDWSDETLFQEARRVVRIQSCNPMPTINSHFNNHSLFSFHSLSCLISSGHCRDPGDHLQRIPSSSAWISAPILQWIQFQCQSGSVC